MYYAINMKYEEDNKKKMEELQNSIQEKQSEIKEEIVPGAYFYNVDKVNKLKEEINNMQEEYKKLNEKPTEEKVNNDIKTLEESLNNINSDIKDYMGTDGMMSMTEELQEMLDEKKEIEDELNNKNEIKTAIGNINELEEDIEKLNSEKEQIIKANINNEPGNPYDGFDVNRIEKEMDDKKEKIKKLEEILNSKYKNIKNSEQAQFNPTEQEKPKQEKSRQPEKLNQEGQTEPISTQVNPEKKDEANTNPFDIRERLDKAKKMKTEEQTQAQPNQDTLVQPDVIQVSHNNPNWRRIENGTDGLPFQQSDYTVKNREKSKEEENKDLATIEKAKWYQFIKRFKNWRNEKKQEEINGKKSTTLKEINDLDKGIEKQKQSKFKDEIRKSAENNQNVFYEKSNEEQQKEIAHSHDIANIYNQIIDEDKKQNSKEDDGHDEP